MTGMSYVSSAATISGLRSNIEAMWGQYHDLRTALVLNGRSFEYPDDQSIRKHILTCTLLWVLDEGILLLHLHCVKLKLWKAKAPQIYLSSKNITA